MRRQRRYQPRRVGDPERLPGESMLAGWVLAVTWRDCRRRFTV